MTREEIIRMAREVFGQSAILPFSELERFAALVAKSERERCAKVCEELGPQEYPAKLIADGFAQAIRALP